MTNAERDEFELAQKVADWAGCTFDELAWWTPAGFKALEMGLDRLAAQYGPAVAASGVALALFGLVGDDSGTGRKLRKACKQFGRPDWAGEMRSAVEQVRRLDRAPSSRCSIRGVTRTGDAILEPS